MGFASPIIVTAKAIMQKLWTANIDWNSSPPHDIKEKWMQFASSLATMSPIHVDRNIKVSEHDIIELIGFSDASSSTAYGACIYLRVTDIKGKTNMHLLCSKSRINPIKSKNLTVPRLELNAGLLLAKLMHKTYETLKSKLNIKEVYLFSGSKIVLAWLQTDLTKLQAYVANRVNVIRQQTLTWHWFYVKTRDNPADLISRGASPNELRDCTLWWTGPSYLHDSAYNFDVHLDPPSVLPEMKPSSAVSSTPACTDGPHNKGIFEHLSQYSDIHSMVRVLAYISRFCHNVNPKNIKTENKFLSSIELNNALMLLIKNEQNVHFHEEITTLKNTRNYNGALKSLHPFIDSMGLLGW